MPMRTIRDTNFSPGTRVVLRTTLNVPVDEHGYPIDEFRLRKACATIEFLAQRHARTVIVAHLGRDGQSLRHVVAALQRLTSKSNINFYDGPLEEAATQSIAAGECLVLENIRRYRGEIENDGAFAQQLALLGDIFVNDAFADSHRLHASIVGVARLLPSYAGLLMEEEVRHLLRACLPPPHSVAIVGGAKFETKEALIKGLLDHYARVCIGGAIANDFLKVRGINIGTSLISRNPVPQSLAHNEHILVPTDAVLLDSDDTRRTDDITRIHPHEQIVDAGPGTVQEWSRALADTPFILWNGPLGIYEGGFVEGTHAIAQHIVEYCELHGSRAVVGGGDTIAALEQASFNAEFIFLSTGGGAMLQFLIDKTLPGIDALRGE